MRSCDVFQVKLLELVRGIAYPFSSLEFCKQRELSSSYEARIKQLQQDLSAVKAEAERAETNMTEALAAKNTEIESLVGTVDALKKQVSTSEGKLVSLQVCFLMIYLLLYRLFFVLLFLIYLLVLCRNLSLYFNYFPFI